MLVTFVLISLGRAALCPLRRHRPRGATTVALSADVSVGLVGGWRGGSTDPDDAYAAELLSLVDRSWLSSVGVVRGNDLLPAEMFTATEAFVKTAGSAFRGPIVSGGASPLPTPTGVVWEGGASGENQPVPVCLNDAVEEMRKMLEYGPATIVATGPLTDIACLAIHYLQVLGNIEMLYVLAGRSPDETLWLPDRSTTAIFSDFNVAQDERAAIVVFNETSIPITVVPFSLSSSAVWTTEQIQRLQSDDCTPRAQMFSRGTKTRLEFFKNVFNMDGILPFDALVPWVYAKPSEFNCQDTTWTFVRCLTGSAGVFNGASNTCAGHGPNQPASLNLEGWQLQLGSPQFTGRTVKWCPGWRDAAAQERFEREGPEIICKASRISREE